MQVSVRVVHADVGPVLQSDIHLAEATSAAAVIGFNVKSGGSAVDAAAKQANVQVRKC